VSARGQSRPGPWWAALTVWGVVNAVCVLQGVGFLSRIPSGSTAVNHVLGYAIVALALPAAVALMAFVRAGEGWRWWSGPAVYLAFVALMIAVEYVRPVEFRSPARPDVLVPYLLLFFGSIVLMGAPMYRAGRGLWLVTVASSVFLLVSMSLAMGKGVG
jgi:phosphatidylserine synthase